METRGLASRAWWLVAMPTLTALAPWGAIVIADSAEDQQISSAMLVAVGLFPLIGFLCALGYRAARHDRVRLVPLAPFGAIAAVFASTLTAATVTAWTTPYDQDPFAGDGFFIVALVCGLLMPFAALVGGIASFVLIDPPRRRRRGRRDLVLKPSRRAGLRAGR